MIIVEQLESDLGPNGLRLGARARMKNTGQIVEFKRVSEQGITFSNRRRIFYL